MLLNHETNWRWVGGGQERESGLPTILSQTVHPVPSATTKWKVEKWNQNSLEQHLWHNYSLASHQTFQFYCYDLASLMMVFGNL